MKPILFLDVDGVLNDIKTPQTDGWPIGTYQVLMLHRIIEATDCKIVLSSSWRHGKEGVEILEKKAGIKIYDTTPTDIPIMKYGRGTEIKMWMDTHKDEVEKYAILDDDTSMREDQKPHFFKTAFQTGLTEEIANEVIRHLT